jgi:predicted Zn-dependent protease
MNRYLILMVSLLFGMGAARAEPYLPQQPDQVLEHLPSGSTANLIRKLRERQERLAGKSADPAHAAALAREFIELGRREADPRYYGYARAALSAWWDQPQPPAEVLLLRATLRQNRHEFAAALADLDSLLGRQPGNAQGWLTRAVILAVQGRPRAALDSCIPLTRLVDRLLAATCMGHALSLQGRAEQAYRLIREGLADAPSAEPGNRLWALTTLAEIALRQGWNDAAERHFQQALALGERDVYLLTIYADFLLDRDQPERVGELLADETRIDALLLRLAMAKRRLGLEDWRSLADEYAARLDAVRRRDGNGHPGDGARFLLALRDRPEAALELASTNWRLQREPNDALLLLRAALAAGRPDAALPVRNWLAVSGLEDARLAELLDHLPEAD